MPADTLSREDTERLERTCLERWANRDLSRVMATLRRALSEPARLAQARAEGYREGVEAVAAALRREIPTGDGSARSLTWSEALDAVDAIRALTPPPAEPASGTADAPGHTDLMVTPESLDALLAENQPPAEPAWTPTHRHYKGGLYRELMRVEGADSDDLVPMVIYEDAAGRRFARAAEAFDGTIATSVPGKMWAVENERRRFAPITPAEPAQPDDGWIKRRGEDTQPVPDDTVVDLRFIDGRELLETCADGWRWRDIIAYRIVKPASAPVAPDERRALNAEVQDYMVACGQHAEARRVAEARIAALEAENAALREGLKACAAFVAAIDESAHDGCHVLIPIGHLRRARALLQGGAS